MLFSFIKLKDIYIYIYRGEEGVKLLFYWTIIKDSLALT